MVGTSLADFVKRSGQNRTREGWCEGVVINEEIILGAEFGPSNAIEVNAVGSTQLPYRNDYQ